jgi:hypothetical protein
VPQREVKVVSDVEVDEISLVDRPANQHAAVVLAKRATQEDSVADEYFNADGAPVDVESLKPGDVIYDAEGGAYEIELDDEPELATVGKSAFFDQAIADADAAVSKSITDTLKEELSKAIAAEDGGKQSEVLSKALEEISKAEQRAAAAETIAKAERDLRLTREYVSKAESYGVPVDAAELGPVLMRMAEAMSYQDCSVINKALTTSGAIAKEFGATGQADNDDPFTAIEQQLEAEVSKNAGDGSRAQRLTAFFDDNPDAYERYRAERTR